MRNIPDRRADDTLFAEMFSAYGDQTAMALLEGISPTNFRRQLDPENEDHPSDLHRAKRLLFASLTHDRAKGERVWAELRAVRDSVIDREGERAARSAADVTRALANLTCLLVAKEEGYATPEQIDAARLEAIEVLMSFQVRQQTVNAR